MADSWCFFQFSTNVRRAKHSITVDSRAAPPIMLQCSAYVWLCWESHYDLLTLPLYPLILETEQCG